MANKIILLQDGKYVTLTGTATGQIPTWNNTTGVWGLGTGGGGGGSGTVTSVSAGTGIAVTGDPAVNPTVSLAALNPNPAGSFGSASAVSSITVDAYGRVTAASATNIAIAASAITSGTLAVDRGGTGLATIPAGEVLLGNGTGNVSTVNLGDGELLIGSDSGPPLASSLTQGTGVTITGAANSITIAIGQAIGTTNSPTFSGLTLSSLTASHFIYANASKQIVSLSNGASRLVGYDSGSSPAVITLGTGLSMSGSTLNATGGTVTSVTMDMGTTGLTVSGGSTQTITSSGTFTLAGTLAVANGGTGVSTAAANTVFAGPTTGAAAAPGFRALVAADLPSLPYDLSGEIPGVPDASSEVFHFVAVRAFTIKASSSNASYAVCKTAPSGGSVTFTVYKGSGTGTSIGTITFANGATTATFTIGSDVSFTAGEWFHIDSPANVYSINTAFFTFYAVQ